MGGLAVANLQACVLLVAAAAGGYAPLLRCRSLQRLLWPDHPIDVLMSVGVGVSPAGRRDKGLSSFMETGALGQGAELAARLCMPSSAHSLNSCLPAPLISGRTATSACPCRQYTDRVSVSVVAPLCVSWRYSSAAT